MAALGLRVDEALIAVRAIHFASTALTAGILIFLVTVADPIFRCAGKSNGAWNALQSRSLYLAWAGLAFTAVSGAAWLAMQTVAMSGQPIGEALAGGVLWISLSKTQFGTVSVIRFALAVLLAISLALAGSRHGARLVSAVAATGLLVAIAWTGHAAGTVGPIGPLHLTADALHLLAAGAWIGGLVPLLLLLTAARQQNDQIRVSPAFRAARRFSNVGIVSVGSLLATGAINSWILVGSFRGLIATDYGLLVLGKIALFTIMTSIAAVNRLRLTPRLSETPGSSLQVGASHGLIRNVVIEITLGLTVFALVGVVGTLHPAIHIVQ